MVSSSVSSGEHQLRFRDDKFQRTPAELNQTHVPYPNQTINQLFEKQVEQTPNAIAVVCKHEEISYRDLNHRANQLAHYLQNFSVEPQSLIGVCLERSIEMVATLLAILKVGCVYVPLDPAYPQEQLLYMLEDAQLSILITERQFTQAFSQTAVRSIVLDLGWTSIAQASIQNPQVDTLLEDLAYVNYTSGSTGKPKGVAISHRGVIRLIFGANYANLDSQQTFLQLSPVSFDATTFELWGALLHGSKCVLFPGRLPTIQLLREVLEAHSITVLFLTTALFNTIIDESPEILARVQQLLTGGEAHSVPHIYRGLKALPKTKITAVYGPTETTTFATFYPIPLDFSNKFTSVPIGYPISNTQTYVLDAKLHPVPVGTTGELYIGGDGLAREYLNRPERTQATFITNPFSSQPYSRLYKTGDLVRYLPDGNLDFLGRVDHQVKIRGFRIELSGIESVLNTHLKVRQAIVLAEGTQAERKFLKAYILPVRLSQPTPKELQAYLKQKLPAYMIPTKFVFLDRLPLKPNGKVDRAQLASTGNP